ncbi:Hypothetical predicted protein [Marmota monax]|uniref:Uncharacterized protein n=1 Tax=Marmota monax TaxID=9995 RepID=A0A5E4AP04_MARMO|nr:Hypothetical predicted protein [Marmota monax]
MLSSSLMHSESELDSDDAIFTWPDREKGKLLHGLTTIAACKVLPLAGSFGPAISTCDPWCWVLPAMVGGNAALLPFG